MKIGYSKTTGLRITGALEKLFGVADVDGFNDDGTPIYGGSTDVDWDSQEPVRDASGDIVYMDEDGEECSADGIEFRDEAADLTALTGDH